MASQLAQLREQINGLAEAANKTGGTLAGFSQTFSQHTQRVEATIGGSAQNKDREVIEVLNQADKAVKEAVVQLQNAARVAKTYGESL